MTPMSQGFEVEQEPDDVYRCRLMIEHNLEAERSIIEVMQRQASQAESFGDRATRYLYEQILLKTEERAYQHRTSAYEYTVYWQNVCYILGHFTPAGFCLEFHTYILLPLDFLLQHINKLITLLRTQASIITPIIIGSQ